MRRKLATSKGSTSEAAAMRNAVRSSAPERVDPPESVGRASEDESSIGGQQDLFHEDEGGLRARDEFNQPLDHIYYLGIIDILSISTARVCASTEQ